MDDRVLSPDEAKERLEAWKGRIDKLAADTKAMSDQFQDLQVTLRDPRGMAEVTVDSSGSLVNLRLTREIEHAEPDAVARAIMDTVRAAKAELADRSEEIIAETVGTESAAARAISASVAQHLRGEDGTDEASGESDDIGDSGDELTWK